MLAAVGKQALTYGMRGAARAWQNPKVRQWAKNTARNAAVGTLRRINRRRRSRGRRVWFPMDERGRGTRNMPQRLREVAVRQQVTNQAVASDEMVLSTEPMRIILTTSTSDGTPSFQQVDPVNEQMWPALAAKANLYSEYDCTYMRITFTPALGHGYNGKFVMGWALNPQNIGTTFPSSAEVISLSNSVTGPVSEEMTLNIPMSAMCNKGKDLMVPRDDVTVQDITRYMMGTFLWSAYLCDDAGTNAGQLIVTYGFRLKKQRVSTNALASVISAGVVTNPGFARPLVSSWTTAAHTFTYQSIRPVWAAVGSGGGVAATLTLDGGAVVASANWTLAGGHVLSFFNLGKVAGLHTVVASTAGTFAGYRVVLTSAPDAAF